MKLAREWFACGILLVLAATQLWAQSGIPLLHHMPAQLALQSRSQATLPAPQGFRAYIVDGKLRLSVEDAIRLALANNTAVQLNRSPIGTAKDAIERAHSPFDPGVSAGFNSTRATSPSFSQLQGAPTLSTLTQQAGLGWSQTFETGTNIQLGLSADKLSTNSTFNFFNPSVNGNFSFNFSQPLLRNRGLFPNRAPIVIAQRNLSEARDNFEAEVNNIIQSVVALYWNVVQARENLAVQKKSVAQA
ncbi:MAG: TolC family protein, partial [Acidobacteriota bacterium]|nr:TolC family protein [Acidobacteriota bacterium]